MTKGIFFVTHLSSDKKKMEVDLEDALDIAGAGRYQLLHCGLMLWILTASMLEMVGYSFVIPAASCDLGLSPSMKGLVASVPNIGVILTAGLWGRVSDTSGRRPALLVSTAAAGVLAVLASLMPEVITFAICKFAASLFLSCPSSLCFAYAGEMLPRKRRDIAMLLLNALLMFATMLLPLLAWGVLSSDWHYTLGTLSFRPWRLLTIVYALPLILSSVLLLCASESPKFLMTRGKSQKALEILRSINSTNTGQKGDEYPVSSLKSDVEICKNEKTDRKHVTSSADLFRPPHLKWLALTGFLMFGVFSSLNGLFIFVPDTINRVLSDDSDMKQTICSLMQQHDRQITNITTCVDSMSASTFQVSLASTALYSVIVLAASLSPIGKRMLLVTTYFVTGIGCLLAGFLRSIPAAIAMSALQFTALGIGPLTAYAVDLFPTSLRGSAVGAVLMFGRLGSVVGANVASVMLASTCQATFYSFAALLFVCCCVSCVFLPKEKSTSNSQNLDT